MTMLNIRLRRPVFCLTVLLCLLAGCARRAPRVAAPPAPVAVPIPVANNNPNPPPLRDVAILYHADSGFTDVAAQLRKLLPPETYRVTAVDVQTRDSRTRLDSLRRMPNVLTVALGLPAARIARDELKGPVLFAGVLNYQELFAAGRSMRGVTALAPLDLQAKEWKRLDPKVRRLGIIVSPSQRELLAQAEGAAKAAALTIKYEISRSDRETLYLFKRMASQIDGLWLVPDDEILSPGVQTELLAYAISHGVRVCVLGDAAPEGGAFMSASPTASSTARTLHRLLEKMMAGGTSVVPLLTPTSELVVRINTQVAGRFGLSSPRSSWVVYGGR